MTVTIEKREVSPIRLDIGPATIRLAQAAAEGEEGGGGDARARFGMTVYTGATVSHWLYGSLTIDLSGIQFAQKVPALLDHDTDKRVGWTDKIELGDEGIVAEGFFLRRGEHAQSVLADAEDGYPWQASWQADPLVIEEVGDGATAKVNGREVVGPATIFRQTRLREVTFTALGADENTRAEALSGSDRVEAEIRRTGQARDETMTTKLTREQLQQEHPELFSAIRQEGVDEGTTQERQRCERILKRATPSQTQLAAKHIGEGTAYADVLEAFMDDPRRNAHVQLKQDEAAAPPALDTDEAPEEDPQAEADEAIDEERAAQDDDELEKLCRREWDANPKLGRDRIRDIHCNRYEQFKAARRAELRGQCLGVVAGGSGK